MTESDSTSMQRQKFIEALQKMSGD